VRYPLLSILEVLSHSVALLIDQSGQSATELLGPIFGQGSHVYEALSGKRPISGPQAKKLGDRFRVNPGLFL
jgi:antitoxin component HigA of HigAB toxin-antitoxin module